MYCLFSNFSLQTQVVIKIDLTPLLPVHKIATANSPAAGGIPGVPGGGGGGGVVGNNNLNINLPENNNAILRLEVELRDKNAPKYRRAVGVGVPAGAARGGRGGGAALRGAAHNRPAVPAAGGAVNAGSNVNTMMDLKGNAIVPLEKVCAYHAGIFCYTTFKCCTWKLLF